MSKEFKGVELPTVAAAQGNPCGLLAEHDITFNGVKVVKVGEFYSAAYLHALEAGLASEVRAKPKPAENKAVQPAEKK
jgi:hypothetical protein